MFFRCRKKFVGNGIHLCALIHAKGMANGVPNCKMERLVPRKGKFHKKCVKQNIKSNKARN